MRKSTLFKVTALVVCLGFLLLTVPQANAIEKKPKLNFKQLIKKPAMIIASIVPFLAPIFDTGNSTKSTDKGNSGNKIKITGTLSCDRVSDGD